MISDSYTWIIYALLSAFFAAFVPIFGKLGMEHIDSTLATLIRIIIMLLFMSIVMLWTNKFILLKTIDIQSVGYIALSAIFGACSWLVYFLALKSGPASAVTALDRLSMVFLVFFASFIGEPLTFSAFIGATMISVGAIILTLR